MKEPDTYEPSDGTTPWYVQMPAPLVPSRLVQMPHALPLLVWPPGYAKLVTTIVHPAVLPQVMLTGLSIGVNPEPSLALGAPMSTYV